MNQMTIRKPSKICWSGLALRNRWIPSVWKSLEGSYPESSPIYGVDITNSVLELLGMAVTIWLVLIECEETGSEDCILALGDSTSAMGGFTSPEASARLGLLQYQYS
jgi:hypothetical protein